MTYIQIKENHKKEINRIIKENGLFYAFNKKQLQEGRGKLKDSELLSIGGGGFIPKKNYDKLQKELAEAGQKKIKAIKQANADEVILYELRNYEAFYSGEIIDAFDQLKDYGFTYRQVKEVYNKYLHQFDE